MGFSLTEQGNVLDLVKIRFVFALKSMQSQLKTIRPQLKTQRKKGKTQLEPERLFIIASDNSNF